MLCKFFSEGAFVFKFQLATWLSGFDFGERQKDGFLLKRSFARDTNLRSG